ncbi:MAG TPA: DUF6036 family nucleotidyltransferase [Candidatus Limnocylindria bacterium]|nr:DUF6036 family nucleotidyltransferase [Candidatus Limnocylindria bacterium]
MTREQLEHILRASSQVIEERDLLVIGSQSVLGTWDERRLPAEALRSIEADLATLDGDEQKSDRIDGALGEGSRFHETFGIYAQGVSLRTAVLPDGWRDRLVALDTESTRPGRGLCLEPHDCVSSKMIAGRLKDYSFATALLRSGLVAPETLAERIELLDATERDKQRIRAWLRGARPKASDR